MISLDHRIQEMRDTPRTHVTIHIKKGGKSRTYDIYCRPDVIKEDEFTVVATGEQRTICTSVVSKEEIADTMAKVTSFCLSSHTPGTEFETVNLVIEKEGQRSELQPIPTAEAFADSVYNTLAGK